MLRVTATFDNDVWFFSLTEKYKSIDVKLSNILIVRVCVLLYPKQLPVYD
jgi:hypothetical protein